MQKKNFNSSDETKILPKTKMDIVRMGNNTLIKTTFEPGWKWSEHVKPAAGTANCQVHHLLYVISGQLKSVMVGGLEIEIGPGDIADIPPGHDAWVLGDSPFVALDITGGKT